MYARESFLIVSLSIAGCQLLNFTDQILNYFIFGFVLTFGCYVNFVVLIGAIAMPSSGQVSVFMSVFMLCLNSAVLPSTDGFWIFCESFAAFMRFIKEEEICLTFCLLSVTCMHVLT